ncbi:MAG: Sporulation initiation inhibitor protein Soj [Deltaproteobacteria bacterium ADurb.Bin026]|nr:AAA family ATPase [Pseudomonadota bacterium]OQC49369.1 MAG: Sporulation initiation inhibitor protein Soj [Deltaproteobacteria bacterium ADurb.Bin026]
MIISIANQKGGVGKTTTSVNLSASIAVSERKTLIVDMDPQCNTTTSFGISYSGLYAHLYHVLIGKKDIREVIRKTDVPFLDIVPSHPDLIGAEIELLDVEEREFVLKKAFDTLQETYTCVFIDCPPSLGLLTINSLVASDFVVIPLQCEYFALEGLALLLRSITIIKKRLNPKLDTLGVLLTMFDKRNNLSFRVMDEVKGYFHDNVFTTVIPRNVKLSEAPSYGKPALLYDICSKGAQSYLELASEIIERGLKC